MSMATDVMTQFGNQLTTVKSASESIQGSVATALDAVSKMVEQTQSLDDTLNKLPSIGPMTAKLEAIARSSGLGGKAVYQVKSKEVVINMNLNVTMDAGEVEKVMIMRHKSIIRDRINFATAGESSNRIPETYTNNLPNISRSTQ